MSFVLHCSAVLPWVFEDEAHEEADGLLEELAAGEDAWVPAIWNLELGNVLLGAMRKKRIDHAGAEAFMAHLGQLEILLDPETTVRAWGKTFDLAQQHGLSTGDAAYLELAMRRGLPVATLDRELSAACRATGVRLKLS